MKLGVCYYPEHWSDSFWAEDARRMRALGISVVRVGEFAWSKLEPVRNEFHFDWLSKAIDTLHAEGLEVVLGTPTATPPKWLINEKPSILATDENNRPRGFGSRRHYCFSSIEYRTECKRIVTRIAQEFGDHPAVQAWQTDNEYGCHSTILSYSEDATAAFRQWCKSCYTDIGNLNTAWGNVFWSTEYNSFEEIDLPNGAVTELNPAHRLAFWRFSSDQVASFNQTQVEILREYSPGRDILHNYMGNFTEFDHYTTAADLDIASWDNYPLGFLDRDSSDKSDQEKWYRTGHPDSSAFHHDLYRGIGRGRLWIIEQQPGPVNWAPHNPAPLPGMVKLWALEAFAHGAEVMSWFRWRQLPFAQEQMHTGLLRPDSSEDVACEEIRQLNADLKLLGKDHTRQCDVAIVFDYSGDQMCRIQPQGQSFDPLQWVMQIYTALRHNGVNIDVVPADADFSLYKMVVLANSIDVSKSLAAKLSACNGQIVIGPRCGSKTSEHSIPEQLAPGNLQALIPLRVTCAESLPDFISLKTSGGAIANRWREKIETSLTAKDTFDDGWGYHYQHNNVHYLNSCLTDQSLNDFFLKRLQEAEIPTQPCNDGLRISTYGKLTFAFNYGPSVQTISHDGEYLIGQQRLFAGDVAVWE